MDKKRALRRRMIVINLILSALPVLVLSILTFIGYDYSAKRLVDESLDISFNQAYERMTDYLNECKGSGYNLFYNKTFAEIVVRVKDQKDYIKAHGELEAYFNAFIAAQNTIKGIAFISRDKQYTYNSTNEEPSMWDVEHLLSMGGENAFFADTPYNKMPYFFGVFKVNSVLDESYMAPLGTGILLLDKNKLKSIVSYNKIFEDSYIFILDHWGQLIASTGLDGAAIEGQQALRAPFFKGEVELGQHRHYVISKKDGTYGWSVGTTINRNTQSKALSIFWVVFSVITLLVFAFSMTGTYIFSIRYTKPIEALVEAFRTLPYSNFESRVQTPQNGELTEVCDSFNSMVLNVKQAAKRMLKTQQRLYEAEIAKSRADLRGMKSQINSHFLYNTLNCIRGLALERRFDKMADSMEHLICILRYALNDADLVTIGDEAAYIQHYMEIQRMRHGGKLRFVLQGEEAVMSCGIVKLALQPIIENSLVHGLKPKGYKGLVRVKIYREGDVLMIKAYDTGVGLSAARVLEIRRGIAGGEISDSIGLVNTQQRLRYFYQDSQIDIKSFLGIGTVVSLSLPCKQHNGKEPDHAV